VIFVVVRKVNMRSKAKREEKKEREEMRREVVGKVIEVNAKLASDNEFMRCGSSKREEKIDVLEKKTEFDLESGDDRKGR